MHIKHTHQYLAHSGCSNSFSFPYRSNVHTLSSVSNKPGGYTCVTQGRIVHVALWFRNRTFPHVAPTTFHGHDAPSALSSFICHSNPPDILSMGQILSSLLCLYLRQREVWERMFSWLIYLPMSLALEKLLVVSLLQGSPSSNREKGRKRQRKAEEGLRDWGRK